MKRISPKRVVARVAERLIPALEGLAYRRFYDFPYGREPVATADEYRSRWDLARSREYPSVDEFERTCGFAIDGDWLADLALKTQVVVKQSELGFAHGRILYSALRRYLHEFESRSVTVLETGTARGFSALCMARAMADAGVGGRLLTFDVVPHDVPMYWNCISDMDGPRSRRELLEDYSNLMEEFIIFHQGDSSRELAKVSFPRVHFAYLDAVHSYPNVMAEFAAIRGRQRAGDMVVFDDYTPSVYPGVVRAADEIAEAEGYSKSCVQLRAERSDAILVKS